MLNKRIVLFLLTGLLFFNLTQASVVFGEGVIHLPSIRIDEDESIKAIVVVEQTFDLNEYSRITEEIEGIKIRKKFTNVFNGFSVQGSRKGIERLKKSIHIESVSEIKDYSVTLDESIPFIGGNDIRGLYDKKNNKLYVNEINSIPFCFAHHLWEARNISYTELLNIMLKDAIDNEVKNQSMTLVMDTDVIKKMTNRTIKEMK